MPSYVIHHRIDTLLKLWEPFEFDGFTFCAWSIDHSSGDQDSWLVKKQVAADTMEEAFKLFSERFHRLVDRIAFIGQCHTSADLETFMITKPNDDRFFCRYTKKRRPVPLHFNEEEIESLLALEDYNETGDTFRYLREATNATSFYTMLVMLVSALEAMAGDTNDEGKRIIDRTYIAKSILKDEKLCDNLFQYGEGIRNQILHGGFISENIHGSTNYNGIVYDKIIDYFNENYNLKVNKDAKGRPRRIIGNYDVWSGWCRWLCKDSELSLQILTEKFEAQESHVYFEPIDLPGDF